MVSADFLIKIQPSPWMICIIWTQSRKAQKERVRSEHPFNKGFKMRNPEILQIYIYSLDEKCMFQIKQPRSRCTNCFWGLDSFKKASYFERENVHPKSLVPTRQKSKLKFLVNQVLPGPLLVGIPRDRTLLLGGFPCDSTPALRMV